MEDPVLLGQALGITLRMAQDTPEVSEALVSDDPRVPNGSWIRRGTRGGSGTVVLELTPLASGLCITHQALVDRFGRRIALGRGRYGRIYDDNIAIGYGRYYWPVVEEAGGRLLVGAEFLDGNGRCASYLNLSMVRTGTRGE